MQTKSNFEIKLLQFQRVIPEDENYNLARENATNFADFKSKSFTSSKTAHRYVSMNVFYDPIGDQIYSLSENQILNKKFIGERMIGMFVTESKFPSQILNVKFSVIIVKKSTSSTSNTEIVFSSESELSSFKNGETIVIPFFVSLEAYSYELFY